MSRTTVVILSLLSLTLTACDTDTVETPMPPSIGKVQGWVTIEGSRPAQHNPALRELWGGAYYGDGPMADVEWTNETTGETGAANSQLAYYSYFGLIGGWEHTWTCYVPVVSGENLIRIRAVSPEWNDTMWSVGGGGLESRPNPAPVALGDDAMTSINTPIDIDVLANDWDPEGDLISVTSVTSGLGGTSSLNPDGTVHFVPSPDFKGNAVFTYSVSDGHGRVAEGTVMVLVVDAYPAGDPIERVSVSTLGTQGNHHSFAGNIAPSGRFVAFCSTSSNLAPGAPPGSIFVHDRLTRQTSIVSCNSAGVPQGSNQQPSLSADGRYIAFMSWATGLVPGDANSRGDIFLRDREAGTTIRISVSSAGGQANETSFAPSISTDGRYIAYFSAASNLVPLDQNGNGGDIFVYDRQSGQTTLATIGPAGTQIGGGAFSDGPSLSGDGSCIAFTSGGQVFARNMRSNITVLVSATPGGGPGNGVSDQPAVSASGRYVTFNSMATNLVAGDSNGFRDVFVRDLQTGKTVRASVSTAGTEANGDVQDYNRPAISADGRFVSYVSEASNLVSGDWGGYADVFVHDLRTGQTARLSVSGAGAEGNGASGDTNLGSISFDGKYVVFGSAASNLVSADSNGWMDVFVAPNPLAP